MKRPIIRWLDRWLAELKFWIPAKRKRELDALVKSISPEEAQKMRKELDDYIERRGKELE
jgi:hypothetical protein